MNIALLMSLASPWGRQIVNILADVGNRIDIITFDGEGDSGYGAGQQGIKQLTSRVHGVHRIKSRLGDKLKYFVGANQLRRALNGLDVEHLVTLYGGGFGTMAWLSGFRPFSIYAVGSDVLLCEGVRRNFARWAMRSASYVFVNGEYLAEQTRRLCPEASVVPLLMGIDLDRYSFSARQGEKVQILNNRKFEDIYNNELILQALKNPVLDPGRFEIVFASGGRNLEAAVDWADRELSQATRKAVTFRGGVSDADMLGLLKSSDIFVSMSRSDGTATSMLEALACGLFPILSDIPQNREWVARQDGFLIDVEDRDALAAALATAVDDECLRERAAKNNRAKVEARADGRQNLERMTAILMRGGHNGKN